MEGSPEREAPAAALAAVLKHSSTLPPESTQVRGYDFNRGVDYRTLLKAFGTTGFQATNFGRAVQQVNAMVRTGAGLLGTRRGVACRTSAVLDGGRASSGDVSFQRPNSWRKAGPILGGSLCPGKGILHSSSYRLVQ